MATTYEPIASQTLGASAASVTFSSIPGTYTDLVLVCMIKSTGAASSSGGTARFNTDSGSNYSHTILYDVGSIRGANNDRVRMFGDIPTGAFANAIVQIMSYANTNVNKTFLSNYGEAGSGISRIVGLWRSTAAITTVTLYSNDGGADSFASGSTFSLYGVKAA